MMRCLPLFIIALSLNAGELSNRKDSCWDGTYDMNKSASIAIDDDRVEIGFHAISDLFSEMKHPLFDLSGIPITSEGQQVLYLAFSTADCSQNRDGTIVCQVATSEEQPELQNTLFVERFIDDIDDPLFAIIPVSIDRATIEFGSQNVTARIFIRDKRNHLVEALQIAFAFNLCNEEGLIKDGWYFHTVYFSDRLKAYIKNHE